MKKFNLNNLNNSQLFMLLDKELITLNEICKHKNWTYEQGKEVYKKYLFRKYNQRDFHNFLLYGPKEDSYAPNPEMLIEIFNK